MGRVTTLPRGRDFSRADLDTMPDDGRRYELCEGTLVVTPAPSRRHQGVSARLFRLLDDAAPDELVVRYAPVDVAVAEDTVLQPDLLVARRQEFADEALPVRPLLVIEILSSSTRHVDLALKRALYEAAGCPSYWVVDPDEPALTVWEMAEGRYVEQPRVVGEEQHTVTTPYPVTVTPSRLVGWATYQRACGRPPTPHDDPRHAGAHDRQEAPWDV